MTTFRTFLATLLTILILISAALAVPVGAVVGTITSEVEDQVAVYRCHPGPMLGLELGDVVAVMRSGRPLGEAVVVRTQPELLVSLKGLYEVAAGDMLVYQRRSRNPQTPRPPRASVSPEATPSTQTPEPSPEAAGPTAPAALPVPPAQPPEAPPELAPETPTPADLATLQDWHAQLDGRLTRYVRPQSSDSSPSPHRTRLKKAGSLTGEQRYLEAAALYGKLGAALQQEGQAILASAEVRGREAWSLGFEALSLRALCLFLAEDPARSRAAFEALLQTNPKGVLSSARALSMVRGRAKTYLSRLPRPTNRTDRSRPRGLTR